MKQTQRNWRFAVVGLVIFVGIVLVIVAALVHGAQVLLPIGISVVSLVVSLLTFFRAELFPAAITVVPGGVCLLANSNTWPRGEPPEFGDLVLMLPVDFLNTGYGDAVIEGLAVKVLDDDGQAMLYRPSFEVDMKKFIERRSEPGSANMMGMVGMYNPFPLRAKQSVRRAWLFIQDTRENPYAIGKWHPGEYQFEYYIKESQWAKPGCLTTKAQPITEDVLTQAHNGVAVMLPVQNIAP